MARTTPGLTDEQVAKLRTAVVGPRKPRVTLLDTQFGAEATGQVVAVGDPAAGDDFITVRVKLGGVTDTLTFGPTELAMPTRARSASAAPKTPAAPRAAAVSKTPTAPRTAAAPKTAAPPRPPITEPAKSAAPRPAKAEGARAEPAEPPVTSTPAPPAASGASTGSAVAPRSRRPAAGRRRSPAPVTVTLSSAGNSWKLTAMRSGRSLVKATPLAPGVVTAVADLLGDDGLLKAVAEINELSLTEAQERARQLRDELAQVESVLKAHQRPGGAHRR